LCFAFNPITESACVYKPLAQRTPNLFALRLPLHQSGTDRRLLRLQ